MRPQRIILLLSSLVLMLWSASLSAEFKKGETYHGFKLLDKRFVTEVNAECFYFEHEKSGARLFKIAADDANKTFSIAFKTLPPSDNGAPHVMEHSVLNGSKNFPVKSPFDVLAKGSLNTFLNAMTGSDITIYPIASMNDKDYFNLMHVYLDAVFNPLIYSEPRILKQEGWHYELTNKDSAVVYKGVVYNEMKGAFSNPTRELDYQVDKYLFPDNDYRFSSGGYPAVIPTLTYEDFLNFHRRYYHPVNSYIFLYGNADLDKELAFIDKEYLSHYQKIDFHVNIPLQPPFTERKEVISYYAVPESSNTENQTYLTLNYVTGLNSDQNLTLALKILTEVLVNQESAPLRLAMQQAGIGQDINASLDELQQNVFQILVQNANPGDKDKFNELVNKTLSYVAAKGLDREAVEGTLNRIEFRLREGDDAQKGLTYNFQAISTWFYADDPFRGLEYEKPLAELKTAIKNGYLESVISQYLLDNKHALLLVLQPKPGLEAENNLKIEKELQAYKSSLSPEQEDKLLKETEGLIEYQKREDTPQALATIPMLDLKDINPKATWYAIDETKIAGVPVLSYETFTNHVVYLQLYYDVRVLPAELIPYAALLAEVLGSLNTANYTFGDLDKALNLHTGGFSTFLSTYLENQDDNRFEPKFVVSSKAMNNKVDKMFELVAEIVNHSRYTDKDRLKAVLVRHQSRLDAGIKRNGYGYTRTRLLSYYTNSGQFNEKTAGIEYYMFISDLAKNFDAQAETIIANLSKAADLLFTRDNLIVQCTCGKPDQAVFTGSLEKFIPTLSQAKPSYRQWTFTLQKKNEGFLTASKVQYVLQGYDYKKLGYDWNGKMRVLTQILSTDWLQNRIRVIGGAYGGWCLFSPNGQAYFASYRDPNLKETLDNYSATPHYLHTFEADNKTMIRYIIGTIADLDQPLTPSQKGNMAVRYYLEKTDRKQLQQDRSAVLTVTAKDIMNMEKMVADILSQQTYCVYGNEEKIQTQKELFEKLVPLSQ
jgi:Zn-dependent M16 (insulinase) family peptidase